MADASVLQLLERISNRPLLLMRRGPMYSAYVELRNQELWRNGVNPRQAINAGQSERTMTSPFRSSMPVFSVASRKDNKKPKGASGTPPPVADKADEKKRVVAGGSMRRSNSCLEQL